MKAEDMVHSAWDGYKLNGYKNGCKLTYLMSS
jgi:hypothetical protein